MKTSQVIWKPVGQTPLQALEDFRKSEGLSAQIPLTYAGRLDPMAEGKLLILVGEECKKKAEYTKLDKEYVFEILFGVSTDTGDILGLPVIGEERTEITLGGLVRTAEECVGAQELTYPIFSSKTVRGKPLHQWVLEGTISEIVVPKYAATILNISVQDLSFVKKEKLLDMITQKIESFVPDEESHKGLGGDFRKDTILARWRTLLRESLVEEFQIGRLRAHVSSGMYIRTLSELIAEKCGTRGLAYSIVRERIGDY